MLRLKVKNNNSLAGCGLIGGLQEDSLLMSQNLPRQNPLGILLITETEWREEIY